MTSWVITISKDYSQHWDYARQHGLWDMPKNYKVKAGDTVYFRFGGGGGLIGQTEATSDARPLLATDQVPWDDGGDPYTTRFTFQLLSDKPVRPGRWNEIAAQLVKRPSLQAPRSWDDPHDEAVFASYFAAEQRLSPIELAAVAMLNEAGAAPVEHDLDDLNDDEKKVVRAYQVMRQGQQAFREALYKNYGGCAITGTTVKQVLDAAHIRPYSGPKSNVPHNGMPLRSDLHRLFDKHLLTITLKESAAYVVRVSNELTGTPYEALDGRTLSALPAQPDVRPSAELLAEHNSKCSAWLTL